MGQGLFGGARWSSLNAVQFWMVSCAERLRSWSTQIYQKLARARSASEPVLDSFYLKLFRWRRSFGLFHSSSSGGLSAIHFYYQNRDKLSHLSAIYRTTSKSAIKLSHLSTISVPSTEKDLKRIGKKFTSKTATNSTISSAIYRKRLVTDWQKVY